MTRGELRHGQIGPLTQMTLVYELTDVTLMGHMGCSSMFEKDELPVETAGFEPATP
jgi:hypothetical protein